MAKKEAVSKKKAPVFTGARKVKSKMPSNFDLINRMQAKVIEAMKEPVTEN